MFQKDYENLPIHNSLQINFELSFSKIKLKNPQNFEIVYLVRLIWL
jgi:hypothetical protein